jgi:hypothetical protein
MRFRWLAVLALLCAFPAAANAAPGVTVVDHGTCVVAGGVRAPDGRPAKAWDMWQEIFQTSAPTWLQAHTHHGAECITTVTGITGWWFAHGASAPDAPPTIVPVHAGQTLYTVQGRVHTAGNVQPGVQAYLGIHLLEQGSDFNYPVNDPSAPPQAKTAPVSVFKNEMPNQVPSVGTLTIANQILRFAPNSKLPILATGALGYYTVVGGAAQLTMKGSVITMKPRVTYTLPRNTTATITAGTLTTDVAATELIPGGHP